MPALGKPRNTSLRERRVAFTAMALFVTCAVSLPILLAVLSSRPDLYFAKPEPVKPGIEVLDWRALSNLLSKTVTPAAGRPDLFGLEIEIAGYMIPAEASGTREKITRFLLVPDPGDWLNPPHFHPGEAIDVRLKDGESVRLIERTAVAVCGRLSFGSMESNPRTNLYLTSATLVMRPIRAAGLQPSKAD